MANFSVSVVNVANRHNFSGGVAYVGKGSSKGGAPQAGRCLVDPEVESSA